MITTKFDLTKYLQQTEISHCERVAAIAEMLAVNLKIDNVEKISELALLHDIGKSKIPEMILNKPGVLKKNERIIMDSHSVWSQRILLKEGYSLVDSKIVRWHHEKLDGSGYPDKLMSEIPIESQVITVADIYDALTSERIYRKEVLHHEEAIHIMMKDRGLNPNIVKIIKTFSFNK